MRTSQREVTGGQQIGHDRSSYSTDVAREEREGARRPSEKERERGGEGERGGEEERGK